MKKRLLCLAIVFALLLTLLPTGALAAEELVRDTDFFTDQPHTELSFSEMEFRRIDTDAALAEMDAVRALLDDGANVPAVRTGFDAAVDRYLEAYDMYSLAYIRSCQDAADNAASEDYQYAEEALTKVMDGMYLLARDILRSPCAAALDGLLTAEEQAGLLDYEAMTEEELELQRRETALVSEYWTASTQDFTAEYNGQTWDSGSAADAFLSGSLSAVDYIAVTNAIENARNAALGELYLQLVELRRQTAALYGYDNYGDFAYENIYQRDYTQAEIRSFHDAVKEYIVPVCQDVATLFYQGLGNPVYWTPYTGEGVLDTIEPFLARMSGEMLESFTYMRTHGLYDNGCSDAKTAQAYTTLLPGYNAPFFFSYSWGNFLDLTTAVHEFGHYNEFYWTDPGWDVTIKSHDLAEVHSQGLELLFTHFYPEVFGDGADAVSTYIIYSMLDAIVEGALYDELQQYVYSTEDLTVTQINQEYCRLCKEYGLVDAGDPSTEQYGWVDVHHNFDTPCYYISYAVSAAGAFAFWLDAQSDFYAAVDDYLAFAALDADYSFQESFDVLGMESPLSPAYLEELAQTLYTELDVEARLAASSAVGSFTDVSGDDWFYEAVDFVYSAGLFSGTSAATFEPDSPMSRAMLATVLYRLEGEPGMEGLDWGEPYTDVDPESWYGAAVYWARLQGVAGGYGDGTFGPDDPITREQLAVMLYRYAGCPAVPALDPDFTDAAQISDWARDAMFWAISEGILNGHADGTLAPQGTATRAQTAQMLMNFFTGG